MTKENLEESVKDTSTPIIRKPLEKYVSNTGDNQEVANLFEYFNNLYTSIFSLIQEYTKQTSDWLRNRDHSEKNFSNEYSIPNVPNGYVQTSVSIA